MSSTKMMMQDTVKTPTDEEFCENVQPAVEMLEPDPKEYAKVVRKIDWRIAPVMFLCYMLSFLDKVAYNYAAVMGLETDLHLASNQFADMATYFFVAFALAEVPQGFLLQRYPVSLVLGANVLLWGIVVACTAATHNYGELLALRLLLGIFEGAITPALTLTTSMWYVKRQSAPRYGVWYSGLGAAQIIGGLVSYGAQHGSKASSFGSWRIMMVAIGVANMVVAVAIVIMLPVSVEAAKFLSDGEKQSLRRMLVLDQAGTGDKVFLARGIWEAFSDVQVWLLSFLTLLTLMSSGVITTFSATLIQGFGYDSKATALLGMPSGAVTMITVLLSCYAIGRSYPRWLVIIVFLIPAILGAGLMSFAPVDNKSAKLAGIFLYYSLSSTMAITFSWIGANTAGYSKKIASNAMIAVGFALGNIISESAAVL